MGVRGNVKSYWGNVAASAAGWGLDSYDWISYIAVPTILADVFFKPLGPFYGLLYSARFQHLPRYKTPLAVLSLAESLISMGGDLFSIQL